MQKPLDGLTVIDMTHVLAGPYCTYQLGLLGAEVIKVESPRGDMVRMWGGTAEQLQAKQGNGFVPQNAGKRSICLDIHQPEGAEVVRKLVAEADIFVENFRPGAVAAYGLDYASLSALRPGLIYLSISAFGQNGPYGHRPGFDDVVQATSGYMSINQRGDGPIRTGGPVLDYASGMHATSAILAAVLLRQANGSGQYIDLAMQDVAMLLMNRQTSIAATTGIPLPPADNRDGPMLGRFATKDGYVMLAGYLPSHCRTLCKALKLEEFAHLSGAELNTRAEALEAAVESRLLNKTSAEWDEVFSQAGVVGGAVRDLCEVLDTGQPDARGLLYEVDSLDDRVQVTSAGYRINDEVFSPASGVPGLGQHTDEILTALGYGAAQIESLRDASVIA